VPDLPEIYVDPERIAQVLGNLITNALRYTPDRGRIILAAQLSLPGAAPQRIPTPRQVGDSGVPNLFGPFSGQAQGCVVVLTVQDNGEGIAADVLPHVFDRFYRGESARSQPDGESGLGLAIAKSIVEAHGGTITAASTLGQGTTFTLTLPVAA